MVYKMWESLLGKEGLSIASEKEVKEIIEDLLIPDEIDMSTFISNYEALVRGGTPSATELLTGIATDNQSTPSISDFTFALNRPPALPLWFIAAYPDVLLWFVNVGREYIKTHGRDYNGRGILELKLLGIDPSDPNLKEEDILDCEEHNRPHVLKNLVQSYKDKTGKEFETAIKDM